MFLSKSGKVDTECRVFQEKWSSSFLFTEVNGKPVCLVCSQHVSVLKEYNLRRHYETLHADKHHHLQGQQRINKVHELLACLKKQQSVFSHSREINDAAVKASYVIAYEIATTSKPFCDGEFVKTSMLTAAELASGFCKYQPDKKHNCRQDFWSFGGVGQPIEAQVKSFIAFSVAIDESTDITDVAPMAILICRVEDTLTVTEEFVELVPMMDTATAADIFTALIGALDRVGVDWSAWLQMVHRQWLGKKAGVVTKFKEKVQTVNGGRDFLTFHCILYQEALCCKSLKMDNIMKVVVQTVNFIRSRGLNHRQFDSLLRENDHNHGLPYHTEVR